MEQPTRHRDVFSAARRHTSGADQKASSCLALRLHVDSVLLLHVDSAFAALRLHVEAKKYDGATEHLIR